MKWFLLLVVCFATVASQEKQEELPLAEPCNLEECQLPDCRCSSTQIPGGLSPRDTPQFVTITFDDAVNIINIETYNRLLDNRVNSNGCPVGATFYVSHEYTNYQLVNQLYNKGFEIALHSITHQTPQTYWQQADYDTIKQEFVDQIDLMSRFANIPRSAIAGLRQPFLQMSGNNTFKVMADHGLIYDCTWPTVTYNNPGLWPYSLDYASIQDCIIPPCPTASIPNAWVLPMNSWNDLNGTACSMVDSCFAVPPLNDANAWFNFFITNFERHYLGNRSPFGFFIHEWFLAINPAVATALDRFIETLSNIPDVFMVNSRDVIDWTRNPVPVNEYKSRPCRSFTPSPCIPATSCGPLLSSHNQYSAYWMQACSACPAAYPWLGNPLGAN